jgi:dihydroflavonol-4-reductase
VSGPVCITGATGFVGSHVVEAFLAAGISVRAAVRSPDDEEKTAHLKAMAERHGTDLTFHEANLREPGSFDEAVAGCEGVIHVAAVARLAAPNPQAQIVDPSIEGAKNVLSAATKAGVRRVILTSSIAAIGSYRASQDRPLTEADWNDVATLETDPYGFAKTSAERLAWAQSEEAPWDLVVLNPVLVLGPVFNKRQTRASPSVLRAVLGNAFPALPKMCFGLVDVRDVATAHLEAYRRPEATGRHLLYAGNRWLHEIGAELRAAYPKRRIRTRRLPNVFTRLSAKFDNRIDAKVLNDTLDRVPHYDGHHAPSALGFTYRDVGETVRDTAKSMVEQGFV